jgi:hypothetical protein
MMTMHGKEAILINKPGFDDTGRPDKKILELIAKNLSFTHEAGRLLNGIILLQQINTLQVQGSEMKHTFI